MSGPGKIRNLCGKYPTILNISSSCGTHLSGLFYFINRLRVVVCKRGANIEFSLASSRKRFFKDHFLSDSLKTNVSLLIHWYSCHRAPLWYYVSPWTHCILIFIHKTYEKIIIVHLLRKNIQKTQNYTIIKKFLRKHPEKTSDYTIIKKSIWMRNYTKSAFQSVPLDI